MPTSTVEPDRAEIEEMVRGGASLEDVEHVLGDSALDQDQCDALWLMAWSRPWNVRARLDGGRRSVPLPSRTP